MSNIQTGKTKINSIDAVEAACKEKGWTLIKGGEARTYYTEHSCQKAAGIKGDYLVRGQGPYDIALTITPDGSYELKADFHGGYIASQFGAEAGSFLQAVATNEFELEAQRMGLSAVREYLDDGDVKIVIEAQAGTWPGV